MSECQEVVDVTQFIFHLYLFKQHRPCIKYEQTNGGGGEAKVGRSEGVTSVKEKKQQQRRNAGAAESGRR